MNTLISLTLAALTMTTTALAQDDQATLRRLKATKLESEFLRRADWKTDFRAALAESARTQRLVFAYFSRSFTY